MNNIEKIIAWIAENAINVGVLMWFLASVLSLGDIVFAVKHDEKETKVSIETPQKPKDIEEKPKVSETPQSSW